MPLPAPPHAPASHDDPVLDPGRLAAVARTGLVDGPTDVVFDRLARLAARLLGAPVGLVSLVDHDRQWFAGNAGLPDVRGTPRSHSFCQLVVREEAPLVVHDARADVRVHRNPAIAELGVVAYCGVPIRDQYGYVIGSLCAIGPEPRRWSDDEVALLVDLVTAVETELALRAELRDRAASAVVLDEARRRADAANRAKTEFLTRMSHELRTPLNAIIGFTGVMLRPEPSGDAAQRRTWLERVRSNAMHLLGIINTILDLARVESGKLELVLEPVPLAALVRETVSALEGAVPAGVALRVDAPEPLAPLRADAQLLRQVLVNLVGNALKFTAAGEVRVTVLAAAGRPAAIEVADTGVGIPPERQRAIFEPFEQAEGGDTRRHYGGTGLGLPVAKALCERMGWRLELARSAPGAGSLFRVRF